MAKTSIEWATDVWNPSTGCDRVSPGCDNCYALTLAKRLKGMGSRKYQRDGDPRTSGPGFGLSVHSDVLGQPMRWREPRRVFVNSMSDLFHDQVPDEYIAKVFAVMAAAPQHTFQILTKRHARMRSLIGGVDGSGHRLLEATTDDETAAALYEQWPLPNVWLGVSVENQKWADIRIPALLDTPAAVRWISAEPLLGPVDLSRWLGESVASQSVAALAVAHGIDSREYRDRLRRYFEDLQQPPLNWVVAGGESGHGARPCHPDWLRLLSDQCASARVPYFLKQLGQYAPVLDQPAAGDLWLATSGSTTEWQHGDGHVRVAGGDFRYPGTQVVLMRRARSKHDAGRLLDGRTWDEYPEPSREVSGV
jgi:protein gp37